ELLAQLASGWWNMRVPVMQTAICVAPDKPNTSGSIEGTTGPGWVGIDADLAETGGHGPHEEEGWSCSWQWTAVFEPAPEDGYLSYRFGVHTSIIPYFASALSGGLYAWISTAAASDSATKLAGWKDVMPWPVDIVLPHQSQALFLGRDVTLSGTIAVKKGKRAKLGPVAGVIVTLASGSVRLIRHDSYFLTHMVGSEYPSDVGRIEYQFHS